MLTYNQVPIYDGRLAPIDFTDLDDIAEQLPAFDSEPPKYSTVLVAYTVACYTQAKRPGMWAASCNIQWAAVLGLYEP